MPRSPDNVLAKYTQAYVYAYTQLALVRRQGGAC